MIIGNDVYTEKELLRRIRQRVPRERVPKRVKIKDTADFFHVDYDDVVVLTRGQELRGVGGGMKGQGSEGDSVRSEEFGVRIIRLSLMMASMSRISFEMGKQSARSRSRKRWGIQDYLPII